MYAAWLAKGREQNVNLAASGEGAGVKCETNSVFN